MLGKRVNLKDLEPYNPGKITIIVDNNEDLWHLFNIIYRGDFIKVRIIKWRE